jgi:hypothetical protein
MSLEGAVPCARNRAVLGFRASRAQGSIMSLYFLADIACIINMSDASFIYSFQKYNSKRLISKQSCLLSKDKVSNSAKLAIAK